MVQECHGYGTRMSVKSNDGGGGVMVQECQ